MYPEHYSECAKCQNIPRNSSSPIEADDCGTRHFARSLETRACACGKEGSDGSHARTHTRAHIYIFIHTHTHIHEWRMQKCERQVHRHVNTIKAASRGNVRKIGRGIRGESSARGVQFGFPIRENGGCVTRGAEAKGNSGDRIC